MRILMLFVTLIAGIDSANSGVERVFYKIDAAVDHDLLTLKGSAEVNIPNNACEVLLDACHRPDAVYRLERAAE